MTTTLLRAGAMTACLLTATAAVGQPPVAQPGAQPGVQPGTGHYRAKQVLGTKILIQGETAIGTVDDIVFDGAGNLEYLIVENAGKLVTVPFEAARFDLERRTAVLPLTVEQYRVIPTYTATTYPAYYTPAYRTEVYRYYGLTPRELRRVGPPVIVRP